MKLILLLSLLLMLSPVFPAHAVNIHYGAAAPQFDLQSITRRFKKVVVQPAI